MSPRMPFSTLMALEAMSEKDTFMSKVPAWGPGTGATYGGHVYAQAVWAASQTVGEGLVVHNVHGYFTLPGLTDRPFIYTIHRTTQTRTYAFRTVTVRQPLTPSSTTSASTFPFSDSSKPLGEICFTCICSFKLDSPPSDGPVHQEPKNLRNQYKVVLEGKKPHDHPLAPAADAPWHYKLLKENPGMRDVFPGLEVRKVDMRPFNKNRPLIAYRQLQFYRMIAPPGKANGKENTNLHACAHLYASDRNSLFLISNALGVGERVKKMGSLSHSVVFHVGSKELLFCDAEERAKRAEVADSRESQWSEEDSTWFCQEAWTPRTEGGRGIHESKIWDSRGVHVASSWQDGLVRTWPEGSEAKGPQHITDSPRREDGRGIKGKL